MVSIGSTLGRGGDDARERVERQLTAGDADVSGGIFRWLLLLGLALASASLVAVLWNVFGTGTGYLVDRGWSFITEPASTRSGSYGVFQGLRGTFWIGVFVVVFSFPIGIAAAIYLEEYSSGGRFARFVELNIRNLAGVPSVVYGVLGLAIFVQAMNGFFPNNRYLGETTAAAGATLAVLVLPIVIITSAEAIRAVPSSLREAGYGVGATKWEVIKHHVLPYAAPGILTGTLLSLARALGEAAPLIVIGGVISSTGPGPNSGFLELEQLGEEFTAMPLLITQLAKKPANVGDWSAATAAAIIVLLAMVVLANVVAIVLRNHFEKKRGTT